VSDSDLDNTLIETAEKSTNTECVQGPVGSSTKLSSLSSTGTSTRSSGGTLGGLDPLAMTSGPSLIKRSQTFSPSVMADHNVGSYICRVSF